MNLTLDKSRKDMLSCYTPPTAEVLELAEKDILCASTPNGMDPYDMENWL